MAPGGVEPPHTDSKFGSEPRQAETHRDDPVCRSGFCGIVAYLISPHLGGSGGPDVARRHDKTDADDVGALQARIAAARQPPPSPAHVAGRRPTRPPQTRGFGERPVGAGAVVTRASFS